MSIKEEIKKLKEEKVAFEKEFEQINLTLFNLVADRNSLFKKLETLKSRTSPLAKTLVEKVQAELEKVNSEIGEKETQQQQIKKSIVECEQNIFMREENPGLYIEEESSIMVSKFMEYIHNHLEDIGIQIKETFVIKEITRDMGDRLDYIAVPTGNIGIFVENSGVLAVHSTNFHFEKTLYTTTESNACIRCNTTEWYDDYYASFVAILLETLEKDYTYGESFKLTIENSSFTLELV